MACLIQSQGGGGQNETGLIYYDLPDVSTDTSGRVYNLTPSVVGYPYNCPNTVVISRGVGGTIYGYITTLPIGGTNDSNGSHVGIVWDSAGQLINSMRLNSDRVSVAMLRENTDIVHMYSRIDTSTNQLQIQYRPMYQSQGFYNSQSSFEYRNIVDVATLLNYTPGSSAYSRKASFPTQVSPNKAWVLIHLGNSGVSYSRLGLVELSMNRDDTTFNRLVSTLDVPKSTSEVGGDIANYSSRTWLVDPNNPDVGRTWGIQYNTSGSESSYFRVAVNFTTGQMTSEKNNQSQQAERDDAYYNAGRHLNDGAVLQNGEWLTVNNVLSSYRSGGPISGILTYTLASSGYYQGPLFSDSNSAEAVSFSAESGSISKRYRIKSDIPFSRYHAAVIPGVNKLVTMGTGYSLNISTVPNGVYVANCTLEEIPVITKRWSS